MWDQREAEFRNAPPRTQTLVLAAAAERLFPAYESFCERERCGSPEVYRAILGSIWAYLGGEIDAASACARATDSLPRGALYDAEVAGWRPDGQLSSGVLLAALHSCREPLTQFQAMSCALDYCRFLPADLFRRILSVPPRNAQSVDALRHD